MIKEIKNGRWIKYLIYLMNAKFWKMENIGMVE